MKANVSMNSKDEFLTIKEVQELLKISRSQIYNLFRDKTLKKYKVKSSTRIKLSEVNAYMDQ